MNAQIPILLYHSVSDNATSRFRRWSILPDQFGRHLDYLQEQGYLALTVSQIAEAIHDPTIVLPQRVVCISFDDGFADFYLSALPHLLRVKFPSTLYVTAGYVGLTSRWLHPMGEGERKMLTWEQLRDLASTGLVELGSHSRYHYQLDTLSQQDAREEIVRSKEILEKNLQQDVTTFAYPHGYHSREVRALVIRAGYKSASAVKHGMSSRMDDPFALARIIITRDTDIPALSRYLAGEGLPPVPTDEPIRTTGWRFARRMMGWFQGVQLHSSGAAKGGDETYGG